MPSALVLTGTTTCHIQRRLKGPPTGVVSIGTEEVPARLKIQPYAEDRYRFRFDFCGSRMENEPAGSAPRRVAAGTGLFAAEITRGRDNSERWYTVIEWRNPRTPHDWGRGRDRAREEKIAIQVWDHMPAEVHVDAVFPDRPWPRAPIELKSESGFFTLDRCSAQRLWDLLLDAEEKGLIRARRREDEPIAPLALSERRVNARELDPPFGWADWDRFAAHHRDQFIQWAEPAPANPSESRYAIMRSEPDGHGYVIWVRVSPNPDVDVLRSSGGFYTIPEEGREAISWAIQSALRHKAKWR